MAEAVERRRAGKSGAIVALIGLVGLSLYGDLQNDTRADEGERGRSYRDIGGVWTICSGTTRGVKANQVATPEDCDALTAADLVVAVQGVERCAPGLKDPTRREQLRAIVRFSNNVGVGAFCRGWWRKRPSVAALINANRWHAAGVEILQYDLVQGRHIPGLANRRRRESTMFLSTLPPALLKADYPLCVTVRPPPLRPLRKPVFYPNNSELS